MGELQADQVWYAPYETNASDAQFMSDPNMYYSQLDNELYYYYPQSSSAPPLYPDPFPPSQMMLNESTLLGQSQELFDSQGSFSAEQPAESQSSYPAAENPADSAMLRGLSLIVD